MTLSKDAIIAANRGAWNEAAKPYCHDRGLDYWANQGYQAQPCQLPLSYILVGWLAHP
jgi:hypothetical protein